MGWSVSVSVSRQMRASVEKLETNAMAGFWIGSSLVLFGEASGRAFWSTSLVYWAAQATGVLIVAPLLFLFAGRVLKVESREEDLHKDGTLGQHFKYQPGKSAPGEIGNPGRTANATISTLLVSLQTQTLRAWAKCRTPVLLFLLWLSAALGFSGLLAGGAAGDIWAYLPFPLLVWTALARGVPVTSVGILGVVVLLVSFSVRDMGPFAGGGALQDFVRAEVFLSVFSLTGLLIASGAEAKARAVFLREQLLVKEAEMERIKAQIQPHFLFNALTAIHSLVETEQERAREGIIALSELLRTSLDSAEQKFVPLATEMKFVENYLILQKIRFEDGLHTRVQWDESLGGCPVLPFLIQPLVENAIKHGAESAGQRIVSIEIVNDGHNVLIRVGNSVSVSTKDSSDWGKGIGLKSLRNRLAEGWKNEAELYFERKTPEWIDAVLRIPNQ